MQIKTGEVVEAIRKTKTDKATEVSGIVAEMVKVSEYTEVEFIISLCESDYKG